MLSPWEPARRARGVGVWPQRPTRPAQPPGLCSNVLEKAPAGSRTPTPAGSHLGGRCLGPHLGRGDRSGGGATAASTLPSVCAGHCPLPQAGADGRGMELSFLLSYVLTVRMWNFPEFLRTQTWPPMPPSSRECFILPRRLAFYTCQQRPCSQEDDRIDRLSHPPSFKRSQSPSEGPRCGTSMGLQGSSVRGSGCSARRFCSTGPGRDVQGFGSCHAGLSAPCLPPSVPPPPAGPLPSPGSAQEMEAPRVRRKAASARGEPPGGSTPRVCLWAAALGVLQHWDHFSIFRPLPALPRSRWEVLQAHVK